LIWFVNAGVFHRINLLSLIVLIPVAYTSTFSSVACQITFGDSNFKAELVFQGLEFPTSMSFLGPDDILVAEKENGAIQRITDGQISEKPLFDVPVATDGERGLLGIAVSEIEDNDENELNVYLYYTESATDNDGDDIGEQEEPLGNRVYRYVFDNGKLKDEKMLLDLPATQPPDTVPFHNGGKILVGPDHNIYIVIGDLNSRRTLLQNIQDGPKPDGTSTIYRITKDGESAEGNPFEDIEGLEKYYAYGIRNSFGMDIDPLTGKLWDTENGPDRGDEINLVEPGFNSGAVQVYGMSTSEKLNSENLVDFDGRGRYSDPEFVWEVPVGVTALKFLDSNRYGEEYENDLLIGDVNEGKIYHFELNEDRDKLSLHEELEDKIANTAEELDNVVFALGFGGITDMEVGPDGYLYILTINRFLEDNGGSIYKVIPVSD
jgi:aldose sugar dehydrogenase